MFLFDCFVTASSSEISDRACGQKRFRVATLRSTVAGGSSAPCAAVAGPARASAARMARPRADPKTAPILCGRRRRTGCRWPRRSLGARRRQRAPALAGQSSLRPRPEAAPPQRGRAAPEAATAPAPILRRHGRFSYLNFSKNIIEGLSSDPISKHIELCVKLCSKSIVFSGDVCMREFKAPGSGRTSQT